MTSKRLTVLRHEGSKAVSICCFHGKVQPTDCRQEGGNKKDNSGNQLPQYTLYCTNGREWFGLLCLYSCGHSALSEKLQCPFGDLSELNGLKRPAPIARLRPLMIRCIHPVRKTFHKIVLQNDYQIEMSSQSIPLGTKTLPNQFANNLGKVIFVRLLNSVTLELLLHTQETYRNLPK